MGTCSECGETTSMPFSCKFCDKSFCSEHRLPENHDCQGLEEYKESRDNETITYDMQREEKEQEQQPSQSKKQGAFETMNNWWNATKQSLQRNTQRRPRQQPSPVAGAVRQTFPENATFALLGTIMIVYLLQMSVPGFTGLFSLDPTTVLQEPWRIITTMFLHSPQQPAHLLVNAMVLYFFGAELERRVGTWRFLTIFFISGIVGSLGFTSYAILTNATTPAVGASGALYGVFATLAFIAPEIRVLAFFVIPMSIRTALVGFAILDVFLLTQSTPIASAAHLAGLLTGLYFGYRLKDQFQGRVDLFSNRAI